MTTTIINLTASARLHVRRSGAVCAARAALSSVAPVLRRAFIRGGLAVIAAFGGGGCVTRGYKLANPSVTAEPVALNLSGEQGDAAATLEKVIVYHGPGSWKRDAYWDEYVVSIRNRGSVPFVLAAFELHSSFQDVAAPGQNPWELEKLSKKWWQTNATRQTGTYLALGAGTIVGAGAAWTAAWAGMWGATASGATATAGAVGATAMLALPLVAGGTVYMNYRRKHQIQDEFNRRRIPLPRTVAPGETIRGSLFFRISPAPQRLVLRTIDAANDSSDVTIDLALLSGLHTAPRPGT